MGSRLRLTIGGGTAAPDDAAGHWRTVVDEFELADAAMSRFRETSEITALNRIAGTSVAVRPSRRLRVGLVASDRAHRLGLGQFDPRVLTDLDRLGYRGAEVGTPGAGEPESMERPRTGRVVEPRGRDHLVIPRPIDLGGIGKGLTLR